MKKAALHNLGCKVNAYETDAMQKRLEEHGYEIVPFSEKADIYIINTCTVTNIADRKSRQMLHKAKKQNPDAVVVAAGCYVQASKEACEADEAIDLVIGNNKKKDIVLIIEEYMQKKEKMFMDTVIDIGHTQEYEVFQAGNAGTHTRAYIKIQDGCNQFCTYCIIPYARGRVRSRRPEEVMEEVEQLARAGYKEIVLTGIHLSSYGIDFDGEEDLLSLTVKLSEIKGVERIRFGSLEPRIITEKFAETISKIPQVCPHFHLSLQSGCDSVLKRMNRHYLASEYYEKCELLRRFFENPAITTDVIVGFPQETEEEFQITKDFLEKVHFFEMHIFKYSRRTGTKAADMPGQVKDSVKTERSTALLALEQKMSLEYRTGWIGKTVPVLVEEECVIGGVTYQRGHTREYVKVVIESKEDLTGQIVLAEITEQISEDTLLGIAW